MEPSGSSPSSDSEFYSVSSPGTVSPASSTDRSFSPTLTCSKSGNPPGLQGAREKKRRPRPKNPSEQRQNASEKEKLRMRDLTKALHHLRTFLPPSVAPIGQTLTKIETLRLAIGYISFLSAQLGLGEEAPTRRNQRPCSPEIFAYLRSERGQDRDCDCGGQCEGGDGSGHAGQCVAMNVEQNFLQSQQVQTTQTYQVYGRNFGYQLVPQAYWS